MDWEEKSTEVTNLMTLTITAPIQVKLTKDGFNNRYKIYKCLKKFLQPLGETQFIHLTQEYYMLNYYNYKNIFEFLDYVKYLEEQISDIEVNIIPNK